MLSKLKLKSIPVLPIDKFEAWFSIIGECPNLSKSIEPEIVPKLGLNIGEISLSSVDL